MRTTMSNVTAVELFYYGILQQEDRRFFAWELTEHIAKHKVAHHESVKRALREAREAGIINYDYYKTGPRTGYYIAIELKAKSNIISEDDSGNMVLEDEIDSNNVAA